MPANFEKQSYWRERFASETSFEWLASSAAFMDVLAPYLQHLANSARILHLGSGTSDLHIHLRQHGFLDVTNIDYEPLALERGQHLERNQFGDVRTKYFVGDATRLELEERYHVAIDKSTADAIACGVDDAVVSMAKGVRRCLEDNGFWVCLSYSPSRFENEHVKRIFEIEVISKVPTSKTRPTDPDIFHYCYLLRPKRQTQQSSR
ncbi:S-adenosyl-L-methionine-dependent methyltransferase [Chaetomidium leptoderma]|uniref:S-adenosyl-L-methionine-dependent methyltransferase n=1 Tax=Chaetomidium leptoderma TaxID=669021 RepID=A0AAN6VGN6_9PEZI|nr:S-adenosyl-L-methionine-dependent methyltransferase [Chaetomidium leptoderma]